MTQQEINDAIQRQEEIIMQREAQLRSKDYVGTKIAMGVATKKDYADVISQTQVWREDINAAQEEIARLKAIEPEEDTAGQSEGEITQE